MQAIRNMLELVRTRLAGLSPSAKLLAGSLVVIIALGLFLVAQWSATTSLVPLAVTPAAYDEARTFLAGRGVEYQEQNGQIMVPAERHGDLLAQFAEQGSGAEAGIDFSKLVELDSPFDTTRQSETRKLVALQNVLSRVITGFRNVKSATVLVSPKPATPLGASRHQQTASVHVTMRTGALTQEQVDSIASLVAGTQAGMKPENVSVTDGLQAYRTSYGRTAATGENLDFVLKIGDAVQARIATLLASIDGVRIAVNPQVVTVERTRTTTEFRDPISAPLSETSATSEMKGARPQREPGAVPNTGLSLDPVSGGAAQTSTERSESKYRSEIPGTRETEVDPTGYAAKIDVGVAIPWSYFANVWKLRNPPAAGAEAKEPGEAEIAPIRDEELARIKRLIEPLVATDAMEGSKKGAVEISWFYDFKEPAVSPTVAASLGEMVLGGGSGGGMGGSSLIKPIGLGILAVASLFFMFNIARKASTREELPSAEELAGVPPKLESDDAEIVGEADEATPALEGMELDDDSLRRAQMLKQLNEMADRDPAEIAGILRRWMRTTT
ncbi:MAG: flagellar M-ring protein FliF C-terminal domain-containing protein [Phycisphaerales bacterium]